MQLKSFALALGQTCEQPAVVALPLADVVDGGGVAAGVQGPEGGAHEAGDARHFLFFSSAGMMGND